MKFHFVAAFLSAVIAFPTAGAMFSLSSLAQTSRPSTPQDLSVLEQGYLRPNGHQSYGFRGETNQTATIALTSREFDTYLELYDIEGRLIERNDDANGNTDSRIRLTLPSFGTYTVVVRGKNADGQGSFALTINAQQAQPSPSVPVRRTPTENWNYSSITGFIS